MPLAITSMFYHHVKGFLLMFVECFWGSQSFFPSWACSSLCCKLVLLALLRYFPNQWLLVPFFFSQSKQPCCCLSQESKRRWQPLWTESCLLYLLEFAFIWNTFLSNVRIVSVGRAISISCFYATLFQGWAVWHTDDIMSLAVRQKLFG